MTTDLTGIRDTFARALDWNEAHATFDQAVDGMPPALRGARPQGWEHSAWQLLEHLRLALADLVDFAVNAEYTHAARWPDDYWPQTPEPPEEAAWDASIAAVHADLARMQQLVRDPAIDLLAPVPTGKSTQTYLRGVLLVLDHNAYHVGQLVALRRALGCWP